MRTYPHPSSRCRCSVGFTLAMSALFVLAAWNLNRLCFYLSFPVLAIFFFYSFTKRFTSLSHLVLGFAIGSAPLAAWIAIRGNLDWVPVLLSAAVMFWIAGFDVIYALQDTEFDREAKLFSLPARFGIPIALHVSTLFHLFTVALLVATATLTKSGPIAFVGIVVVGAILFWEHRIVKPNDLSRVNVAFFNLNGYISILLLLTFATDIFTR